MHTHQQQDVPAVYDFLRCLKCNRLCTRLEESRGLGVGKTGRICPCGGLKYSPTDATWRDYEQVQVIQFARSEFGAAADYMLVSDMMHEAEIEGLTAEAVGLYAGRLLAAIAQVAA